MKLGIRPDPDGIGVATAAHEDETHELWHHIEQNVAECCLGGVSPVIASDFQDAMADWRRQAGPTVQDYARQFAAMAALLTHGSDVRAAAATQPARIGSA